MTQSLLAPQKLSSEASFSIGICAADRAANLEQLLPMIDAESFPAGFDLRKIILVASACDPKILSLLRQLAARDERFILIEEPVRRGKAVAINQIIAKSEGDFLLLVNSDALPELGAISRLLEVLAGDKTIGMVSASPYLQPMPGIAHNVSELMWNVHNECLIMLNHGNLNNHCCDELLAIRSEALHELPTQTVNDGAYLAGSAVLNGYSVRFNEHARVRIEVPETLVDVIRQRRRIVYGHSQIWKSFGQAPKTLESMLFVNPLFSLKILVNAVARSPKLTTAIPFALFGESVSAMLAIWDTLRSTTKHAPWERYGSKS